MNSTMVRSFLMVGSFQLVVAVVDRTFEWKHFLSKQLILYLDYIFVKRKKEPRGAGLLTQLVGI